MNVLFWGRATCDLTYLIDNNPLENEKIFSKDFLIQPGGPALNAALTFSHLGGKASVLSSFGNNHFGNMIAGFAKKKNIQIIDFINDESFEIPFSTILVNKNNGSRTIINSPAEYCRSNANENHIERSIFEINPGIVLIDGYELEKRVDMLKQLKKKGALIVFDGGSWKGNIKEYLPLIDIAICSNRFRFPETDLQKSIDKLQSSISQIAFTRDELPILCLENQNKFEIKIDKIPVVDTLGAGDVFHGAFCFYYSQNKNFRESLKKAAEIAGKSCKYFGTHTWWQKEKISL